MSFCGERPALGAYSARWLPKGGTGLCDAGEPALVEPRAPEGASEEVKKAFSANTAGINDVLELRHISIASSHMADDDVDPEYVCPICLVSALCAKLRFRFTGLGRKPLVEYTLI